MFHSAPVPLTGLAARLLALIALALPWPAAGTPRIAIVIDDIGYHAERGLRAIRLPAALTCAVIPLSPHGPRLAREAAKQGCEVIIHMPMAASNGQPLDAGGIDTHMATELIQARISEAFDLLPQARGLNNHMGSLATSDPATMDAVMASLARHGAFFLDSRTSAQSVGESAARRHGLPTTGRDVFLDNHRDLLAINEQFNQLLRIARRRGHAIAIGHPYPETLEYLERVLPLMPQAGIEIVPVSRLLRASDTPGLPRNTGPGHHPEEPFTTPQRPPSAPQAHPGPGGAGQLPPKHENKHEKQPAALPEKGRLPPTVSAQPRS